MKIKALRDDICFPLRLFLFIFVYLLQISVRHRMKFQVLAIHGIFFHLSYLHS